MHRRVYKTIPSRRFRATIPPPTVPRNSPDSKYTSKKKTIKSVQINPIIKVDSAEEDLLDPKDEDIKTPTKYSIMKKRSRFPKTPKHKIPAYTTALWQTQKELDDAIISHKREKIYKSMHPNSKTPEDYKTNPLYDESNTDYFRPFIIENNEPKEEKLVVCNRSGLCKFIDYATNSIKRLFTRKNRPHRKKS